jgi:hypothetical protein
MDHCHTIKLKDKQSPEDDNRMFMETLKQPQANNILLPACSETRGQATNIIYKEWKSSH